MMIRFFVEHQTPVGIALLVLAVVSGAALVVSHRAEPRQYTNVLLLDVTLMLLIASISLLTRRMTLLHVIWRLLAFMVVPLTAAVIGALLIWDGVVMLRHEGKGRSTLLTFFSGVFLLGIMTFTVLAYRQVIHPPVFLRPLMDLSVLASFFVALTFLTMVTYGLVACHEPRNIACDYIIVHGCAIFGDRLPPLLRGRVDKAVEMYNRRGGKAKLVVSGGMGPGESITEAEAMRRYLESLGFPMEDVILEDRSTTTRENLRFVRDMLDTDGVKHRYICVTSDYHVFRTVIYARKEGLDAIGAGSRTALYYRPGAAIREYVAVMLDAKWMNLGLLLLWALLTGDDFMRLGAASRQ